MKPGVHDGLPESKYFGAAALSSSGARRLLNTSPAHFHHEQTAPRVEKAAFDIGHAVHAQVLGVGQPIARIEAADWRTKDAREQKAEAHANGLIPVLAHDWDRVAAMTAAVLAHPLAAVLFDPSKGTAERSIFWRDEAAGVDKRARLDMVHKPDGDGRVLAVDLKSCRSAAPAALSKSVHEYGLHQQQAWYTDALTSLPDVESVAFLFAFVEKEPPHVVTVAELDWQAVEIGAARNARATRIFAECTASGVWPGYFPDDEIALLTLPPWATREDIA